MKNRRLISLLLALVLLIGTMPAQIFAQEDKDLGKVHVIVENTIVPKGTKIPSSSGNPLDKGFIIPWDGKLIDEDVPIKEDSTMMSLVGDALDNHGYKAQGLENDYISKIHGLGETDAGSESGWMGTLNDWFTNQGFGGFSYQAGNIEDGDLIRIMYTRNGHGEDLGGSWNNNNKSLDSIEFSQGNLDKTFSPDVHDYTLTLEPEVTEVKVTPTAKNKNFQVRTFLNRTENSDGIVFKRTKNIPVNNQDSITVEVGRPGWPTMNDAEDIPSQVYTFTIKKNGPEIDKEWINKKLDEIANGYKEKQKKDGKLTDWWAIIELAKYEQLRGTFDENTFTQGTKDYIKSVTIDEDTKELDTSVNSLTKNILAIRAMGYDPEDYYGFNLVEALAKYESLGSTVNAVGPALNALNSDDYTKSPSLDKAKQKAKKDILSLQQDDGFWPGYGVPWDQTGFALYGLGDFYHEEEVKAKLAKTLKTTGDSLKSNGDFATGAGNSNSLSMMIGGLATIDPNLLTENNLVKKNNTMIDGLKTYHIDGGFKWKRTDAKVNGRATEQAFRALITYISKTEGKGQVFDFRGTPKEKLEEKVYSLDEYKDWLATKYKEAAKQITSDSKHPDDLTSNYYPAFIRNGETIDKDVILKLADSQARKAEDKRYSKELALVIFNLRVIGKDPENYKGINFVDQLIRLGKDKFRTPEEIKLATYALTSDDYNTAGIDQKLTELYNELMSQRGESKLWESRGEWQERTGHALAALATLEKYKKGPEDSAELTKVLDETIKAIGSKQEANGDLTGNSLMDRVRIIV